jgi:hypothetical protein
VKEYSCLYLVAAAVVVVVVVVAAVIVLGMTGRMYLLPFSQSQMSGCTLIIFLNFQNLPEKEMGEGR